VVDHYLAASDGGVQQPALVTAVHPPGGRPASWARGRRGSRSSRDPDRLTGPGSRFYLHICQVWQQYVKDIKIARRT